jgi:hypothetical protein
MRLLAEQPIVVSMTADPEPYEPVRDLDRDGAIVSTDPDRPEATDPLEVKRWMTRVLLQAGIGLIGELLDARWQGPVKRPEIGGCVVRQSGVVLPAAWSRRAF